MGISNKTNPHGKTLNESVIELSQQLIRIDSITPEDKGCQKLIAELLDNAGFSIEHKRFADVDNLFAFHGQKSGKNLIFVGHTDVVPTGDEQLWKYPPFSATIEGNTLYGRGAADMKTAVAAFTLAMIEYVKANPQHSGVVALMLTSDEEGVAQDGIKKMMPHVAKEHDFDYCLVGEPSSSKHLGDTVRIGRRGSLHVTITIHGKQGHVAYPEKANNPVFLAAKFIDDLSKFQWDNGNQDFPPSSFQISAVKTSTNTSNIIPADLFIQGNFRYSPESSQQSIQTQLESLLEQHNLSYSLDWEVSGLPFHSKSKVLKQALEDSIMRTVQQKPIFNAAGGTSDGRFIAPFGVDVVELGVVNDSIHQINECVLVNDVINLQKIYFEIIDTLLK
jgi:succinyl-diaminopimelate desuccinylase